MRMIQGLSHAGASMRAGVGVRSLFVFSVLDPITV